MSFPASEEDYDSELDQTDVTGCLAELLQEARLVEVFCVVGVWFRTRFSRMRTTTAAAAVAQSEVTQAGPDRQQKAQQQAERIEDAEQQTWDSQPVRGDGDLRHQAPVPVRCSASHLASRK